MSYFLHDKKTHNQSQIILSANTNVTLLPSLIKLDFMGHVSDFLVSVSVSLVR